MKRDTIIIGGQEFAGRTILDGNCFVSRSLPCDELTVDTLSATLDGSERRGTRFIPRGSSGLRTRDNKIFYVRPYFRVLVNDLTVYGYGEPVLYYHDGKLIGRFYMEKPRRVGKYSYEITCVSAVGLLEGSTHYGDIYNGVPIEAVLADIIGGVIPYTLDPVFADTPIYGGWLPVASRRLNLHQLLFAVGASAGKDANGELYITALSAKDPSNISDDRLFLGGSIDYGTPITAAEVSEHTYIAYAGDSAATLYEGKVPADPVRSPRGALLAGALVTFDDGPMHDLVIEGGSILESGVNYAVLGQAASCKLTGQQYTHTTRVVRAEKPVSRGLVSVSDNTARVTDATLVTLANSENVAQRVLAYYGYTRTVSTDMVVGTERPGSAVSFMDPFDDMAEGFVKSMDIRMGGLLKAAAQLVAGYIPPDIGNFYKHSVVLTGGGTWTVPDGVTRIRVACISGGTGGYSGRKGKSGKEGAHEGNTQTSGGTTYQTQAIRVGEFGIGGLGGYGGPGGKVFESTIAVAPGQRFAYACGIGGGGGARSVSVDDSNPGNSGADTNFGEITSAAGLVYPAGYRNIITGQIFAAPGAEGIGGGNGQGVPGTGGGNPVIYEGVQYEAGAIGERVEQRQGIGSGRVGAVVEGGFGGGAAAGANGNSSPASTAQIFEYVGSIMYRVIATCTGGVGATPATPRAQTVLGGGGHGGHGGGGGGANNDTETGASYPTSSPINGNLEPSIILGDGGLGGEGGVAAGGCIVIYYG